MFITNNEIFVAMKKMHEHYLHFLQKEYDYLKTKEIEMAKRPAPACNRNDVVDDGSLYVVFDDSQLQLVAAGIQFDDIEDEVVRYLDENEYTEDDVEISVYKETAIWVEINSKPKVTVKRN